MTDEQLQSLVAQFRKETEDLIEAVVYQWYFNDGQVWASTTEVLNLITLGNRKAYRPINVDGTLYWFKPDLTTLEPIFGTTNLTVANGTVFYRKSAGDGPPEVQPLSTLREDLNIPDVVDITTELENKVDKVDNYSLVANSLILKIHDKFAPDEAAVIKAIQDFLDTLVLTDNNYTDEEKAKLNSSIQNVYELKLGSSSDVSTRLAGLTEGIDYPTGWALGIGASSKDLLITHGLNRRCASISIFAITGAEEQLLMNTSAFNGIKTPDSNSIIIQSLATIAKELKIYIVMV